MLPSLPCQIACLIYYYTRLTLILRYVIVELLLLDDTYLRHLDEIAIKRWNLISAINIVIGELHVNPTFTFHMIQLFEEEKNNSGNSYNLSFETYFKINTVDISWNNSMWLFKAVSVLDKWLRDMSLLLERHITRDCGNHRGPIVMLALDFNWFRLYGKWILIGYQKWRHDPTVAKLVTNKISHNKEKLTLDIEWYATVWRLQYCFLAETW